MMKYFVRNVIFLAIAITTINIQAADTSKNSPDANQHVMSAEEAKAGAEQGRYCIAKNNLSYSLGAVIEENKKFYRCVKNYRNNLKENIKLVWVELTIKNGEAVTAD